MTGERRRGSGSHRRRRAGTRVRTVEVAGRPARFREVGIGRPIVLVHGLGLSGRIWSRHAAALSVAGWRVIAPDLPSFGQTPGPRYGYSTRRLADWLVAFGDAAGVERGAWVGHSITGGSVLRLAADHPGRAAAVIVASPTGSPGPLQPLRDVAQLARDAVREPATVLLRAGVSYLRASPRAVVGTWLKSSTDGSPLDLERVRCPVLIIQGAADPLPGGRRIETLKAGIPHARLIRVRGTAHGVVLGSPERVSASIAAFLRRVGYPPGAPPSS